jgi:hypothetical protein
MLSSDRLELIRQVSNEVTSCSRLYQDIVYKPDFVLAYQGGLERVLCTIDEFVGGRYRDLRMDVRFITDAMKKSGIPNPNLVEAFRSELLEEGLILGIPKHMITRSVHQGVQNGVWMIGGNHSSFDQMRRARNKSYPSNFGILDVSQGSVYGSPRKANPHQFKTGLTRKFTQ